MSAPRVTILMPVYNGEKFLHAAITSVLRQTERDFELLLIDDGSTDCSVQIATEFEDPRIRIVRNEKNLGLVPTLNRGLDEARAPFIARADADDLNHPVRLERQLDAIEKSGAAVVGSDVFLIDGAGKYRGKWRTARTSRGLNWDLGFRCCFAHGSVLFRSNAVKEVGGYRDSARSEDWDLWSRLAMAGHQLTSVPAFLMKYRQHAASITSEGNASDHLDTLAGIRKRHLAWLLETDPSSTLIARLCEPWDTGDATRDYFEAREAALGNFGSDADVRRTAADEDYMLYFRKLRESTGEGFSFLKAMAGAAASTRWYFPWQKALLLGGLRLLERQ